LEEAYVAAEVGEGIVGLGISETELEIWNTWKAPDVLFCSGELGRDPKLENFRLVLELITVFAVVDRREARDVHLPTIVVLTDALGEKVASLRDLKNLVGGLGLGLLLVP
jgi:hypothetical protein